jgi:hypothetical protein
MDNAYVFFLELILVFGVIVMVLSYHKLRQIVWLLQEINSRIFQINIYQRRAHGSIWEKEIEK